MYRYLAVLFFLLYAGDGCFARQHLDSSKKPGTETNDIKQKIAALNQKAAHLNKDSTNQAIAFAYQAYLLAYENKYKEQEADALVNLAQGYLYNDVYDQALEYAYNALEIYTDLKMAAKQAATNTLLGWIFYDAENLELALKYHLIAHKQYQALHDQQKVALSENAEGLIWQLKNDCKKATPSFLRAQAIARKIGDKPMIAATYNNLGICCNFEGHFNEAIQNFQLALQYSSIDPLTLAEIENQMAYSYVKLNQFDQARKLLNQARQHIDKATSNSKKEKLIDNYKTSSLLNQLSGNYKEAFNNLSLYNKYKEELQVQSRLNALVSLTLKREAGEKEKQIKELSAEKTLRAFQRNALAVIIVLLIIIGFMVIGRLRVRQKKKAEIAEMNRKLVQHDLETTLLDKQALNDKLEFNNTELKNYALHISHRNELVGGFVEQLLLVQKSPQADISDRLLKLINQFKYEVNMEKSIEDFNLQVESKYKDFFYNLQQQFPDLTDNERRLCAQIRLNLSIKEIAALNNISVRSAEMARYRLRKHLNLQQNDSLGDFLKSF